MAYPVVGGGSPIQARSEFRNQNAELADWNKPGGGNPAILDSRLRIGRGGVASYRIPVAGEAPVPKRQ